MAITGNDKVVCDWCGKFISNKDLSEGAAYNYMKFPDSELTTETYESKCKKCIEKENNK